MGVGHPVVRHTSRGLVDPHAAAAPSRRSASYHGDRLVLRLRCTSFHATAERLASLLGPPSQPAGEAAGRGAHWRIADPALDLFDTIVDDEVMLNPNTGLTRDHVGLARVLDPSGVAMWVFTERVADNDAEAWRRLKRAGGGRDPRLLSDHRDSANHRFVSLAAAMADMRPRPLAEIEDWPHKGPRAITEVLQGIRGVGREVNTFHELWLSSSGLHPESSTAWEHKMILRILHHLLAVDHVDLSNLSGAELAARRLMLERAVKPNSRTPNFLGLHRMVETAIDDCGHIQALEFSQHIASQAESEARILKQQRLLREELKGRATTTHRRARSLPPTRRREGEEPPLAAAAGERSDLFSPRVSPRARGPWPEHGCGGAAPTSGFRGG